VLREKRCHPSGCLEFLWKCKLLGKGGACPKGYRHVGNNCTQCRYYDEEKLHRYPEVILPPEAYRAFQDACRQFDEWLEDHEGRLLDAGGRVASIRPNLLRRVDGHRSSLVLRGFLLRLEAAFIGRDGLADALYLRISRDQQQRHRIAVGDELEPWPASTWTGAVSSGSPRAESASRSGPAAARPPGTRRCSTVPTRSACRGSPLAVLAANAGPHRHRAGRRSPQRAPPRGPVPRGHRSAPRLSP